MKVIQCKLLVIVFLALVFCFGTIAQATSLYDSIGFNKIKNKNNKLSSSWINGSNNGNNKIPKGTIILYKTSAGRFGKMLVRSNGYKLVLRWTTYRSNGNIYSRGSNLTIRGNYSCDLDKGKETTVSRDFWWNQKTSTKRYLVPKNKARFLIYNAGGSGSKPSGGADSSGGTRRNHTISMPLVAAIKIAARSSNQVYTLGLSWPGLGKGAVEISLSGDNHTSTCFGTCEREIRSGQTATLRAYPDSVSSFSGWSGCDSVYGDSCTVENVHSNRTVTAAFNPAYSGGGVNAEYACAYNYPVQRCLDAGWHCVARSECNPSISTDAADVFDLGPECNCTSESRTDGNTGGNCSDAWRGNDSDIQVSSFCSAACEAKKAGNASDARHYCALVADWHATGECTVCP